MAGNCLDQRPQTLTNRFDKIRWTPGRIVSDNVSKGVEADLSGSVGGRAVKAPAATQVSLCVMAELVILLGCAPNLLLSKVAEALQM